MMLGVPPFLWQSALILLIAYFLGAWFGCMFRRLLTRPPKMVMAGGGAATAPTPDATSAVSAPAPDETDRRAEDRFGRALQGSQGTDPLQYRNVTEPAAPLAAPRQAAAPPPDPSPTPPSPRGSSEPRAAAVAAPRPDDDDATIAGIGAAGGATLAANATARAETPARSRPPSAQDARCAELDKGPSGRPVDHGRHAADADADGGVMSAAVGAAAAAAAAVAVAARSTSPSTGSAPSTPSPSPSKSAAAATSREATQPAPAASRPAPAPTLTPVPAAGARPTAPAAPQAAPTPVNNLGLINAIGAADAETLSRAGITSFQQIAAWTRRDLDTLPASLGGRRRIARENWIEQAALLAKGTPTAHIRCLEARAAADAGAQHPTPPASEMPGRTASPAARAGTGTALTATSTTAEPQPATTPPSRPAAVQSAAEKPRPADLQRGSRPPEPQPAAPTPDQAPAPPANRNREDLTRIDGISGEVAKALHAQGITRISQIANWSDDDLRCIDRLLGGAGRVRREDWVDQARRLVGGNAPQTNPAVLPTTGAATVVGTTVAGMAAAAPLRKEDPRTQSAPRTPDAASSKSTASSASLPTSVPLSQARQASSAPVAAIPAPPKAEPLPAQPVPQAAPEVPASSATNVERLRSVRSAALLGGDASDMRGSDDLKRIRGIGVLIEKRLNMMGYTRYAEIAEWSQADIERVNKQLDIAGRIERESWIEQARILVGAGGQAEFSRRHDRGNT